MRIRQLHRWPRSTKAAIRLQERLATRVRLRPLPANAHLLAGVDVAFSPDGSLVVAGVVVWDLAGQALVEQRVARVPCTFPYVPGLLSFRETPGILAAIRKLKVRPQVFLCDAQGLAHPRRFGLACHLGLWLDRPAIGCAKSRLCGQYDEPRRKKGATAPLLHNGERIGTVLRTRDGVKPLFVSPGHLCDHGSAVRLTLAAATRYRLPEPTRLADQLATRARRSCT